MGRHKVAKIENLPMDKPSGLETEIRKIVFEILREEQYKVAENDIKDIISKLLPDLDAIVAKAIKKHTKVLIGWIDSNLKE
jgi:hypothetical protein